MHKLIFLIAILVFTPVAGCGYLDTGIDNGKDAIGTGKDIIIDNRLNDAQKREALIKARREVEKSRRAYDSCVDKYSEDTTKCEREKEAYDADVETYSSIQEQ